jgi:GDP-4-dehydro-6-deoxy-D-mannose reductase
VTAPEPAKGPILVTGAAGFVGAWLLAELARAGYEQIALHRPGEAPIAFADLPVEPAADAPPRGRPPEWAEADIRERDALIDLVRRVQPRAVVHLAAIAVPSQAAADPAAAVATNLLAVDHLLHAVQRWAPHARTLLVSTGEVYGRRSASAAPASEHDALEPATVYAATKAAAEQRAALAVERDGLDVVRARPFNHTGPGRPPAYAESSFAQQIARAEQSGSDSVVRVGNLTPIRDWSDVRDVVRAYRILLERGEAGQAYNVCSGRGRSVREVLDFLRSRASVSVSVEVEPGRYEEVDPARLALVGSPVKLARLGWSARYSFETTLESVLADWRSRVATQRLDHQRSSP